MLCVSPIIKYLKSKNDMRNGEEGEEEMKAWDKIYIIGLMNVVVVGCVSFYEFVCASAKAIKK